MPSVVDEANVILDGRNEAFPSVDGGRDNAKVEVAAVESVRGRSPARGHWPWQVVPSLPCTTSSTLQDDRPCDGCEIY